MEDRCPICGVTYQKFRTGLTYPEVYMIVWDHPQKRRNTVLGRWREMKLGMWDEHIKQCALGDTEAYIEGQEIWEY